MLAAAHDHDEELCYTQYRTAPSANLAQALAKTATTARTPQFRIGTKKRQSSPPPQALQR